MESLQGNPREAQKLASMNQKKLPRENQEGARCPGIISSFGVGELTCFYRADENQEQEPKTKTCKNKFSKDEGSERNDTRMVTSLLRRCEARNWLSRAQL